MQNFGNVRLIWQSLIRDRTCTVEIAPQDLAILKRKLSGIKHRQAKAAPELGLSEERLYYSQQASPSRQGYLNLTISLRDPLQLTPNQGDLNHGA